MNDEEQKLYNEQMMAMQREMTAMRQTIEQLQGQRPQQQVPPVQARPVYTQPQPQQQVPPVQARPVYTQPQPQHQVPPVQARPVYTQPQPQQQVPPVQPRPVYSQQPQQQVPPVQPRPVYTQPIYAQPVYTQQPPKERKSFEAGIGKVIMGILASVLILIGLTLFAVAIFGNLTDTIKMVLMYVVSFAFLIAGLIGYIRNGNGFFASLTGCGVGAIYISLFTTYGYFEMLHPYVLLALLAAVTVGVYFIGRKKSIVFKIIGEIAIFISTAFGLYILNNAWETEFMGIYIVLSIFVIGLSVFYIEMNRQKGLGQNLPGLILNFISGSLLFFELATFLQAPDMWAYIFMGVWSAYYLYLEFVYVRRIEKENTNTGLSSIFAVFVLLLLLVQIIAVVVLDSHYAVLTYVITCIFEIGVWGIAELRRKKDVVRIIAVVLSLLSLSLSISSLGTFSELLGIGVLVLPIMLIGYLASDKLYVILSFVLLMIYGFDTSMKYFALTAIVWSVCMAAQLLLLSVKKNMYHYIWKILSYLAVLFFMVRIVMELPNTTTLTVKMSLNYMYGFMVLVTALVVLTPFSKTWGLGEKTREKGVMITAAVVNSVLLVLGMIVQMFPASILPHICITLGLLLSAVIFLWPEYKAYGKNTGFAIYNGIKLAVLLTFIILGWHGKGYLLSVCWLVLAIVFIGLGFGWKKQGIRIFGLVVSLLSICKLLIFDIRYDSSILRAVSFIICGILCFGINLIYIIADKNAKKSEQQNGVQG